MAEAYIVSAVRTAGGRRGGRLKDWHLGRSRRGRDRRSSSGRVPIRLSSRT